MLGFLSNLRDVKSALSVGMLLLFSVWLLTGEQIVKVVPGDTLAGKVATLVAYLGPVATIAVITFAAYVVGLVLPFHSIVLGAINRHNRKKAIREGGKTEGSRLLGFIQDEVVRAAREKPLEDLIYDLAREIPGLTRVSFRFPWWIRFSPRCLRPRLESRWKRYILRKARERDQPTRKEPPEGRFEEFRDQRKQQKALSANLFQRIYTESALLAVDLSHKDSNAYERFDKARSESEFRAGLCIPLLLLTAVVALHLPPAQLPWGLVAVIGIGCFSVLVLLLRAMHKAREAQEEVNSAIILGRIKVRELQVLQIAKKSEGTIDTPSSGRRRTILGALFTRT